MLRASSGFWILNGNPVNPSIDPYFFSITVTPVPAPEPSTLALLATGVFGWAIFGRQRRTFLCSAWISARARPTATKKISRRSNFVARRRDEPEHHARRSVNPGNVGSCMFAQIGRGMS